MKKNKVTDERVVAVKRKIQSDAFGVIWLLLLVSVLIQQQVYGAPLSQYMVEIVLFTAMSFYIIIANILKGNDLYPSKIQGHKLIVIQSLVIGISIAVINAVQNYIQYRDIVQDNAIMHVAGTVLVGFISAGGCSFILLEALFWVNSKKQQAMAKELEGDDE